MVSRLVAPLHSRQENLTGLVGVLSAGWSLPARWFEIFGCDSPRRRTRSPTLSSPSSRRRSRIRSRIGSPSPRKYFAARSVAAGAVGRRNGADEATLLADGIYQKSLMILRDRLRSSKGRGVARAAWSSAPFARDGRGWGRERVERDADRGVAHAAPEGKSGVRRRRARGRREQDEVAVRADGVGGDVDGSRGRGGQPPLLPATGTTARDRTTIRRAKAVPASVGIVT